MALIVPEESQRPYRFGMTLVCIGALFNWLGLADHHTKPVPAVRYIGVGLVASGAVLICMAMCFWMNSVHDDEDNESIDHIHVISLEPPVRLDEKPPDYATVVDMPPPSYDDAVKLDPQRLLTGGIADGGQRVPETCAVTVQPDECDKAASAGVAQGPQDVPQAGTTTATGQQQQPTTLAQVIRKSIRDIRKQLTNTVSDVVTVDVEQQQQQQQQQQQGVQELNATTTTTATTVVVSTEEAQKIGAQGAVTTTN